MTQGKIPPPRGAPASTPKKAAQAARRKRLAEALRANLRRRKTAPAQNGPAGD